MLILSSLSEDYFEYQRTLEIQRFVGLFVEPTLIHSNIEDDLDIFARYSDTNLAIPPPD
ncbi:MAG: hypothetical protein OXD43_15525 [Bacteroidetes bacterium]|nr:hypothetical protein [Bacteroidota bacterium]